MVALIEAEDLTRMYVGECKPIAVIAAEMDVSVGAVFNYLKKYGIPTRRRHDYPVTEREREAWRKNGSRHKGKRLSNETKQKIAEAHTLGGIGHKKKRPDGYIAVYFPDHPKAGNSGYIMEHVLVMECLIGRHLHDDECVHHINEDKADNRKSNLQLMTKNEHMSYHAKKRHENKKKKG